MKNSLFVMVLVYAFFVVVVHSSELLEATRNGNIVKVKEILSSDKKDVDINQANPKNGDTALHIASRAGFNKIVQILLKWDADVNISNKTGQTPLFLAAKQSRRKSAKILLENGADASIALKKNGYTPAHIAAKNGRLGIIKDLKENGSNINLKDNNKNTPLDLAKKFNRNRVASYISSNIEIKNDAQEESQDEEEEENNVQVKNDEAENSNNADIKINIYNDNKLKNKSEQSAKQNAKKNSTKRKSWYTPGVAGLGGLIHLNFAGSGEQLKVAGNRWAGGGQIGIYYSFTNIARLDFIRLGVSAGVSYLRITETIIKDSAETITLPNRLTATSTPQKIQQQDLIITYGLAHLKLIYPRNRFIHPYVDIGLGYVWTRNRSISHHKTDELNFNGFIVEGKGGFNFKLSRNFGIFVEAGYRYAKPSYSIFTQNLSGVLVRGGLNISL